MSYYRYITGVYKSYWPELNRTLRSSSVPRTVPPIDPARYVRGTSMPPQSYFTDSYSPYVASTFYSSRRGRAASPFRDRAMSVPYTETASYKTYNTESYHSNFDCKVMKYSAQLEQQETTRNLVSQARNYGTTFEARKNCRNYPADSFSARYDFYDGNKHGTDYIYPINSDLLGRWKHYNLSADTLNSRNARAKSPLISRELDRYYETQKRSNYIGDISSGGANDFRYYNYRRVPYFGGSDNYNYIKNKGFARRI